MHQSWHLVTRLPVQAGGSNIAGPIMAAGGEQDEVTRESLVLPHHDDVPHLTEWHRHITHPIMAFISIINEKYFDERFA